MRFKFESNQDLKDREESDWRIDYELYQIGMVGSDPLKTRTAILNRLDEIQDKLEKSGKVDSQEYDEMLTCAIDANGITLLDLGERHNQAVILLQNVINSQVRLIQQVYRLKWYNRTGNWIRSQYRIWFVVERNMDNILADSIKETAEEVNNEQTTEGNKGII